MIRAGNLETGNRSTEIKILEIKVGIKRYEDLNVWKESMLLAKQIYKSLSECKDYGLRNQMQRAAVSIPSNIAEGYDRGTNKEYINFLNISKGSCAELRTQLYIAKEINIFSVDISDDLIESTKKISAMLYNLIKVRKEKF